MIKFLLTLGIIERIGGLTYNMRKLKRRIRCNKLYHSARKLYVFCVPFMSVWNLLNTWKVGFSDYLYLHL